MDYIATHHFGPDGLFTNTIVITVLGDLLPVSLTIVKHEKGAEITTYSLTLRETTSPVPSLTNSPTNSSTESTSSGSDDSYDFIAELMSAPNSDGSEEELTMTPARLAERYRSTAMVPTQINQHASVTRSSRGSSVSDSWQLLEYIPSVNRIKAVERSAAEAEKKARWNGDWLLKLLDTGAFDSELKQELQTVINLVRHMNIMLFKGKNGTTDWKIKPDVMEELEEVTIQVIHFFDEFGNNLNLGIDKIHEVKAHLPSPKPDTDPYLWRTALRVWNARLMEELAPVRKREKQLFEGLAEFYDAMVYHPFLQVRKINSRHDMCRFNEHFDAIYQAIEFLNEAYATIDREMHKFGAAYQTAQKCLFSVPEVYGNQYDDQIMHDRLQVRMKANPPEALDCATSPFCTMTTPSSATVGNSIETSKPAFKSAMTATKEDEAEEDREFQAIIVHLQNMKLEKAAAKAKAAGNGLVAITNKDRGTVGSSSTSAQAMERFKKKNVSPKKNFSF